MAGGVVSPISPSGEFSEVTPNDSIPLAKVTRSIYVGTAGDLTVVDLTGTTVTFVGVLAGTLMPLKVRIVKDTATTADDIVALH